MIRFCAFVLLAAGCSTLAPAQASPTVDPRSDGTNISAGFSYFVRNYTHSQLNKTNAGMPGWDVAFKQPHAFSGRIGYVVDLSGHYAVGSGYFKPALYSFTAGPEFSFTSGHSTVFLHVTGGLLASNGDVIAQTSSDIIGIVGAGGGIDIPAGSRLTWRIGADWYHGGFNTKDTNQISQIVRDNVRVVTGPVFHF